MSSLLSKLPLNSDSETQHHLDSSLPGLQYAVSHQICPVLSLTSLLNLSLSFTVALCLRFIKPWSDSVTDSKQVFLSSSHWSLLMYAPLKPSYYYKSLILIKML